MQSYKCSMLFIWGLFLSALCGLCIAPMSFAGTSGLTSYTPTSLVAIPAQDPAIHTTQNLFMSGFDNTFTGTPNDWNVNDWNGATFEANRETDPLNVYSGSGAQHFRLISKGDEGTGNAELNRPFVIQRGTKFVATLFIKADRAIAAEVFIRRDSVPRDRIALKTVELSNAWQKVEISGMGYAKDMQGSLRISVNQTGANIWVDQVSVIKERYNDLGLAEPFTVPDALFGLHINKLGKHNTWPALGQKVIRLWDTGTRWDNIQRHPYDHSFSSDGARRLDYYVNHITRSDPTAEIIYTMGRVPEWVDAEVKDKKVMDDGGRQYQPQPPVFAYAGVEPPILTYWRDYVQALGNRYKGVIHYWEIWNEADHKNFYAGSIDTMVRMTAIAHEELKRIDPQNQIISPSVTTSLGITWLEKFLNAGGGAYVDIIGAHFYFDKLDPEAIVYRIENLRELLRNHQLQDKPIWNTEGAPLNVFDAPVPASDATPEQRRAAAARALLLMATKQVGNFDYHFWEGAARSFPLVHRDFLTPTPEGLAYAEAIRWLKGAQIIAAYRVLEDIYVIRLKKATQEQAILWSTRREPTKVLLPTEWGALTTVSHLFGGNTPIPTSRQIDLTNEPVLLPNVIYSDSRNQPPLVFIMSPHSGNTLHLTEIPITINAEDRDGSVTQVDLYSGSTFLGTATATTISGTMGSYVFVWRDAPAGKHSITAVATDNEHATATSRPIVIEVAQRNVVPSLGISVPLDGTVFEAPSDVAVKASVSQFYRAKKIEFYADEVLLGAAEIRGSFDYRFPFLWKNAPIGEHAITVVATYDDKTTETSLPVTITVKPPNLPPTVAIQSPATGMAFQASTDITLTANANDDGSVAQVDFYAGTTWLGTAATNTRSLALLSSHYTLAWQNVPAGNYSITAVATDDRGVATTSQPVTITVKPPNLPPTVAIQSPVTRTIFQAPANIELVANANDDSAIARVDFYAGTTWLGTTTTISSTRSLTSYAVRYRFTWQNVPVGEYSITAVATDDQGATTTSQPVTVVVNSRGRW